MVVALVLFRLQYWAVLVDLAIIISTESEEDPNVGFGEELTFTYSKHDIRKELVGKGRWLSWQRLENGKRTYT